MLRSVSIQIGTVLASLLVVACGDDDSGSSANSLDPGTARWEVVAPDQVREDCGLDPDLLREADESIGHPWAVVRYGKLCHEYYPEVSDSSSRVASATKTLGAVVTGIAAYQTRNLEGNGRKTGPLSDGDRIDHWLDDFSFNPDAQVAHVLGMVAFNEDLSFGNKIHEYDGDGSREINRLSDVINTAIAQDPDRFGSDLEEFTQRHVFEKLGMRHSTWSDGRPDKIFGVSWDTTIRDMARLGLLILNRGVWNGQRLLSAEWTYRLTHPSFEDANPSYGYLTWLAANSNYGFGITGFETFEGPLDNCTPPSINAVFPHGISDATDCNYNPPWTCEQENDVGVWYANGAGGHMIVGHPGLDMVLIGKSLGRLSTFATLWQPMRGALIAADPVYHGDAEAFCEAYRAGRYAPDLQP